MNPQCRDGKIFTPVPMPKTNLTVLASGVAVRAAPRLAVMKGLILFDSSSDHSWVKSPRKWSIVKEGWKAGVKGAGTKGSWSTNRCVFSRTHRNLIELQYSQ